jgi:hypothetical protein
LLTVAKVVRVEMQYLKADPTRPAEVSMASAARHILRESGPMGFFRGVVPRIGVAAWAIICMGESVFDSFSLGGF